MIAGCDAKNHGEAKNSWLTGTAAWTFTNVSQHILGVRPDFDGLIVDPCIPDTIKDMTIRRTFRGAEYIIKVENPDGNQKGIKKMLVDGKEIEGNLIPLEEGKKVYNITAIM